MTFDWRILREPAPTSLAGSRQVAHYAVQWVSRAAVANLPAALGPALYVLHPLFFLSRRLRRPALTADDILTQT